MGSVRVGQYGRRSADGIRTRTGQLEGLVSYRLLHDASPRASGRPNFPSGTAQRPSPPCAGSVDVRLRLIVPECTARENRTPRFCLEGRRVHQ